MTKSCFFFFPDATAKTPAKDFAAIPKKDAFRNFECGCLQSNHRKITECGLFGAPERQVASFGSRVSRTGGPEKRYVFSKALEKCEKWSIVQTPCFVCGE